MSGIPTHFKEEPTLGDGDGNSVASHSQRTSICMSTVKEEPDADLPRETESIRVEFEENDTFGNDVHVKQEAREEVDNFVFIKIEPESSSGFLPEMTGADSVQVKEDWIEDVKVEEPPSSVDNPTVSVDTFCGPIIEIESCLACTEENASSIGNVKQVHSEDALSSAKTSIVGKGRCRTVGFRKVEQENMQGDRDVFSCYLCSKSFRWKCYLIIHMRQHTGERPYLCDTCKSRFSRACDLKKHKRIHTGEKPFVCELCGSGFREAFQLKVHKRVHSGEKPYLCDICKSRFSQACDLMRHKRIHSGERPFVCDVCESRFRYANHLKVHKRTHTGEKPYMCDVCESRFSQSCDLKKHKRIHTGEKPFVCDICDSRFSEAGNLKKHRKIHSAEKPFM